MQAGARGHVGSLQKKKMQLKLAENKKKKLHKKKKKGSKGKDSQSDNKGHKRGRYHVNWARLPCTTTHSHKHSQKS